MASLGHQIFPTVITLLDTKLLDEPPRVCRRPFGLSYAAMADCSSMA
jgi:hypothetical protein